MKHRNKYAFAVGRGPEIRLDELPPEFREEAPRAPRPDAPPDERPEAERIRWALARTQGKVGEAASLLGMSRPTFWRRRKQYGV